MKEVLKRFLENYKKDFKSLNYSLVFSVSDSGRMTILITDIKEIKPYCGVDSTSKTFVSDFLDRKLAEIKKLVSTN